MWFFLALFFALQGAISTAITKRILKTTDILVLMVFGNIFFLIFMGLFLAFLGIPRLDQTFWVLVVIGALMGVVINIAFMKAIKLAPISLTAPMAAATPLVATLFGFLFLGEQLTNVTFLGILFIVLGAYIINITDIKSGFLAPLLDLFKNRGVQLMLFAQSLVGITPVIEKTAIFHTYPQQPAMVIMVEAFFVTLFFLPIMLFKTKKPFAQFKSNMWWIILPAPLSALAFWAAFTAYSLSNIGYVTAIFKLSSLFTILLGGFFFREHHIQERLVGAFIMLLGTILLVL